MNLLIDIKDVKIYNTYNGEAKRDDDPSYN